MLNRRNLSGGYYQIQPGRKRSIELSAEQCQLAEAVRAELGRLAGRTVRCYLGNMATFETPGGAPHESGRPDPGRPDSGGADFGGPGGERGPSVLAAAGLGEPQHQPMVTAELADVVPSTENVSTIGPKFQPRLRRPLILFALTCVSTFLAGATLYYPQFELMPIRRALISHWGDGLVYMVCVLSILLAHEMGHFLTARRYGVAASYPYFIPLPIAPSGTMGAVIMLDGMSADRKEIFDIGLAGPIAGLVVCIPIMWIGVQRLDFSTPPHGMFQLDLPLALDMLMNYVQPRGYTLGSPISQGNLNPYFMAGWLGLFITGLNMLPMSQLDGGHVIYTLFGRRSHWIARGVMILALAYMVYSASATLIVMVILIFALGLEHPPTRDDQVPLGWFRSVLGTVCLLIPVFCLPLRTILLPPGN